MKLPKPAYGSAMNPQKTGESIGLYSKAQMIEMATHRQWHGLTKEEAEECLSRPSHTEKWKSIEALLKAKNEVTDA